MGVEGGFRGLGGGGHADGEVGGSEVLEGCDVGGGGVGGWWSFTRVSLLGVVNLHGGVVQLFKFDQERMLRFAPAATAARLRFIVSTSRQIPAAGIYVQTGVHLYFNLVCSRTFCYFLHCHFFGGC